MYRDRGSVRWRLGHGMLSHVRDAFVAGIFPIYNALSSREGLSQSIVESHSWMLSSILYLYILPNGKLRGPHFFRFRWSDLLSDWWIGLYPAVTLVLYSLMLSPEKPWQHPAQALLRLSLIPWAFCNIFHGQLLNSRNCTPGAIHPGSLGVYPSCFFLSCAVAGRALMIRRFPPLSAWEATSSRAREDKPIVMPRYSPIE